MGFAMKIGVFFILMAIVFGKTNGTSYKIGDSAGWTNHGVDYKSWAASKVFHVGDVFLFQYNKEFHNVVRVTHKNFNACNSTSPYKTLNSGYDSFTVKRPGHYYFICGFGDHCRDGQRVDIRVARSVQPPTNPPAISPPSNPPTISPPSQAPHVPPSNPPAISPPSNPPTISPPSQAPHVPPSNPPTTSPPSNPPTISPPSPAPHVPPSNPPTISPPSPAPYVPAPVPVEPPLYSPVPTLGGLPVPYAPVPAPANSGNSQYPGIIGYTMFLASVLIGIGWF